MSEQEQEFSFKNYFVPFNTGKAIWFIILIGIIVFANMLINGFVWDDTGQIVENNAAHSLYIIPSYFFGTQDPSGHLVKIDAMFYRPLMATFFTINYALVGPNPFFYHFLSLMMHIGTTIFIYFLFRRFFKQSISFFLALIFLVHPLNTETVDYIGAYNDLMYAFFGMISFILIKSKQLSFKKIVLSSVFLFLSFISKETGALFVPVLLYYGYFYQRNYFSRIVIAVAAPCILYLILRFSFITGMTEAKAFGFSPFLHMSPLLHLENIPKLFTYYIHNFFYPNQLAVAQQWSVQNITVTDFYIPLLIMMINIAVNVYLLFRFYKKKEKLIEVFFFSVWFWIGMGLYMQIIPLDMTVADRWFYFPMIGLLGLIGLSIGEIHFYKVNKKVAFIVAMFCIVLFSVVSIIRNTNWYSEKTLFVHDLQISQNSFDIENHVGMVYFADHNYKEARIYFQRSINLWKCSDAQNNLGYVEQVEGHLQAAAKDYMIAVNCTDGYKDYGNLILLLVRLNKLDLAEKYTKQALQKYYYGPGLYFILGVIEYKKGDKEDALKSLATGYQLSNDPQIAQAYAAMQQNKPVDLPL